MGLVTWQVKTNNSSIMIVTINLAPLNLQATAQIHSALSGSCFICPTLHSPSPLSHTPSPSLSSLSSLSLSLDFRENSLCCVVCTTPHRTQRERTGQTQSVRGRICCWESGRGLR